MHCDDKQNAAALETAQKVPNTTKLLIDTADDVKISELWSYQRLAAS